MDRQVSTAEILTAINRLDVKFEHLHQDVKRFHHWQLLFNIFISTAIFVLSYVSYSMLVGLKDSVKERALTLAKTSRLCQYETCNQATSSVAFIYGTTVGEITAAHTPCVNGTKELIHCRGIDIALYRHCPKAPGVLDISQSGWLELGDRVLTYGFAKFTNIWEGTLSGRFGLNETGFEPFTDQVNLPPDTHVFSNGQDKGHSGAGVLNSVGIVGIAVATIPGAFNNSILVAVIGMDHVYKCIEEHAHELPTIDECTRERSIEVFRPPNLFSIRDNFNRLWRMMNELIGYRVPLISPSRVYPKQSMHSSL